MSARTSKTHVFAVTCTEVSGPVEPPDPEHDWEWVSSTASSGLVIPNPGSGQDILFPLLWITWARPRTEKETP